MFYILFSIYIKINSTVLAVTEKHMINDTFFVRAVLNEIYCHSL